MVFDDPGRKVVLETDGKTVMHVNLDRDQQDFTDFQNGYIIHHLSRFFALVR